MDSQNHQKQKKSTQEKELTEKFRVFDVRESKKNPFFVNVKLK